MRPPGQDPQLHPARDAAVTQWNHTRDVLREREAELLELKGPCSTCRLHYAHRGPCDIRVDRM